MTSIFPYFQLKNQLLIFEIAYIATLNLPNTLSFQLAEEDVAKLSTEHQSTPSGSGKRRSFPMPNLLESLSKNVTSSPPTATVSPITEFPPAAIGGNQREFFLSVNSALGGLDPEGTRPLLRRKLVQPRSRVSSPILSPTDAPRVNYGPGSTTVRNHGAAANDKIFATAEWTVETQQFGVNGGLINAVHSAQNAGALQDYKWIGTLGMVK